MHFDLFVFCFAIPFKQIFIEDCSWIEFDLLYILSVSVPLSLCLILWPVVSSSRICLDAYWAIQRSWFARVNAL